MQPVGKGCEKGPLESGVSEVTSKSAVVGIDSKSGGASSDPLFEAITQQIAYLMSAAITNWNTN